MKIIWMEFGMAGTPLDQDEGVELENPGHVQPKHLFLAYKRSLESVVKMIANKCAVDRNTNGTSP